MYYEFRCRKCGKKFFENIPMTKCTYETIVKCENCGGDSKRDIEAPSIHFHGGGFYCNESGKNPASS